MDWLHTASLREQSLERWGSVILHHSRPLRQGLPVQSNQEVRTVSYLDFSFLTHGYQDELETSMWEVGPGPNGTVEIAFVCKNTTSGKIAIANGVAHVMKKTSSRL